MVKVYEVQMMVKALPTIEEGAMIHVPDEGRQFDRDFRTNYMVEFQKI